MAEYTNIFWVFLALCCSITYRSSDYYKKENDTDNGDSSSLTEDQKKAHTKLIQKYLFVYLTATFSDWLQGPYVYALYSDYGFQQHEIAQLFVAGFGSSMVFGSFVGGIADQGGRRLFVLIFAGLYLASCMTKRELLRVYLFNGASKQELRLAFGSGHCNSYRCHTTIVCTLHNKLHWHPQTPIICNRRKISS